MKTTRHDPVIGSLGRHLAEIDKLEARERLFENWLETADAFEVSEIIQEEMGTEFWDTFKHVLKREPNSIESLERIITDALIERFAEEEAADAL